MRLMCKTFILPTQLILGIRRGWYKHGGRQVAGIWSEPCVLLIYCTQLHGVWSLLLFSEMHIRQKFQWTSEQLNSAYLGWQYFHPNFLQNIFLCCWNDFNTPFLSPLFLLYSILVSSFYLSINIVMLYQFTVTCIEIRSMRSLGRIKSSRFWLFFDNVPENIACSRPSTIWAPGTGYREERNGFVKVDVK